MAQTSMAADALRKMYPDIEIEIVPIVTRGDRTLNRSLSQIGGKGVFVNEIETALADGEIDMAVHSAKDLPAKLREGLEISAVLPRGDHRDVLVTLKGLSFERDSCLNIGTGSMRRRMNFRRIYPNAHFSDIRGNVDTRLEKLCKGDLDGIILAAAGLERLGIREGEDFRFTVFEHDEFLPAPCQGIIAAECASDSIIAQTVRKISHLETLLRFEAEREIVRLTGGDCTLPIGAFSVVYGDEMELFASKDPEKVFSVKGKTADRLRLAKEITERL